MLKQMMEDSLEDALPQLNQQQFKDFSTYQKSLTEDYKSRAQKRKERVQKLTKHLHDPEQRKLKRQERKQLEKDKMHQIIDNMTKEQARQYLDALKKQKHDLKQKVRQAMTHGQVIMVDMVYETKMNQKENRSLAKQIELIMKAIKHTVEPPSIHLCNFSGGIQQQMERMGYKYWAVTVHGQNVVQVGKKLDKKLIYLSPDAPLELESVQKGAAYILGGLVDRTILKDASLKRAQDLGIEARRLPISAFMKGRLCLNLDHVVSMLCRWVECKDWKQAFDYAAPKRWKKQQQGQVQKSEKQEYQMSTNEISKPCTLLQCDTQKIEERNPQQNGNHQLD